MRAFSMTGSTGCVRRTSPAGPRARHHGSSRIGDGAVDEVMAGQVACVPESEPIESLRRLFLGRRVGGVPVVGPDGRPVGIVSGGDLLRSLLAGGTPPTTAGEIMTRSVLALPISASIAQAAALMSYEGVDLIVITDLNGQVAGVVQALDIARWHARSAGYLVDREGGDRAA